MINEYISGKRLSVYVKPNKSKSKIICWDKEKEALIIEISAAPEKGEANMELLKLLKKVTKKQWKLVSGHSSKRKVLELQ